MTRIIDHGHARYRQSNRRGAMAYTMLVSMVFFTVLAGFLFEIGRVSLRKCDMQAIADAQAQSAGVMMARAMNELTGTNHQIGEAMSFVVLHRAMCGENADASELDSAQREAEMSLNSELSTLGAALKRVGAAELFPACAEPVNVSGAIGSAQFRLKEILRDLYRKQYALMNAERFPELQALTQYERESIKPEWDELKSMETRMRKALGARKRVESEFIGRMEAYQERVVRDIAKIAAEVGEKLRLDRAGTVEPHPRSLRLPVVRESVDFEDEDHRAAMTRSQIVRSTYPWVVYDRAPVIERYRWMVLSGFSEEYRKWTDEMTTMSCRDHYRRTGRPMFILAGRGAGDKGTEAWRTDSAACDRLFAVIGFHLRPSPLPLGAPALPQENVNGFLTYAQALIYNAGGKSAVAVPDWAQPSTGWDTLNWANEVDVFVPEFPVSAGHRAEMPRVRPNWQSKMTPVTSFLDSAIESASAPVARILETIVPVARSIRTL